MSKTPAMPSLNALRAFEAMARLRSISKAALELNVTQGAISRHLKTLEETLGLSLLTRGIKESVPTADGHHLAEGLSAAFSLIHATLERMKPGPLTLSCSSSMTVCWLLPRMARFYAKHPEIEMKLDMNYDRVDFTRDDISIAIRNSIIDPPKGAIIKPLGAEWIGPVCSPEYLKANPLPNPSALTQAVLLKTMTRPEAWADWLCVVGQEQLQLPPARRFEHFYEMIQAAACSLGVAIVPHVLAHEELRSGRLIAPFGFVEGNRRLSLWIAPHLASRPDMKKLERWLVNEFRVLATSM